MPNRPILDKNLLKLTWFTKIIFLNAIVFTGINYTIIPVYKVN